MSRRFDSRSCDGRAKSARRGVRSFWRSSVVVVCLGVAVVATSCSNSKGALPKVPDQATSTTLTHPTGAPITIGFTNAETGTLSQPSNETGAQAALQYVNQHQNGINGRTLRFDTCNVDSTVAGSVSCANQLVAAKVPLVVVGVDDLLIAAMPTYQAASIPITQHFALIAQESQYPEAFFVGAASNAYGVGQLLEQKKHFGVKSSVFILPDVPSSHTYFTTVIAPAASHLSMTVKPVFYALATTDFTTIVTAAMAGNPGAIGGLLTDSACTNLVQAAHSLSYAGTVFAGQCTQFVTQAGAAANGVTTEEDLYNPSSTNSIPQVQRTAVKAYVDAMTAAGSSATTNQIGAQETFNDVVIAAEVLRTIKGTITPATVAAAYRATHNLAGFMGQPVTCDGKQWPGDPAACASGLLYYTVKQGRSTLISPTFTDARGAVG